MKRLLVIGFLFGVMPGLSQSLKKIDSLINAGEYGQADAAITAMRGTASGDLSSRLSNKQAEILLAQGKLDEAQTILEHLIESTGSNEFLQAETKTNLGFLLLNKARNDLALSQLQEALSLFERAGKSSSPEAARCLSMLSIVYLSTGKMSQAEEDGLVALQLRQKISGEASEDVAASYNDLGLVYSQTDPDKAINYYEMAMKTYEMVHGKEHRKIAIASNNLGAAYRNLKLYGDAINNFETAETIWKRLYPSGHPNLAFTLVNLGLTYNAMGNNQSAEGYFNRALAMYKAAYGERHSDIAVVLNQIGLIKLEARAYNEALGYYQQALIANSPSFAAPDVDKNPVTTAYYNAKVMMYTLRLKVEALESRHLNKTLRLSDLKLALATLQSCDTLIDNIRYSSSNENDKLEIGASANDVHEGGVRIAQSISEMTIHGSRYRELAFYFAEKSKSAVLLESIADSEAKSFAGIPPDVLETENQLKATSALLIQKLAQKPGPDEETSLRKQLFDTNQQHEALVKRMEKEYPDYFNLKFNSSMPSVADVQKQLRDGQVVVSYFVAEKGGRLYSFVITKNRFRVYNSTLPPDFERQITGYTNGIFFMAPDVFVESSQSLAKLLLRGVPKAKEIIFIPSGRLGTIPFEALLLGKLAKDATVSSYPYLVNQSDISYEFSAGLLLQKSSRTPAAGKGIFLCAPVSFPEKDNLDDLPGTRNEVKSIARVFGNDARVVLDAEATEALVKSGNLASYPYLHFATHGVVDEVAPELSRIYLQNTPGEDGNVFSGEIFNLKLNANLAVLSACQTGLGRFSRGEGVIGLSRALVYAGARSIIVSYWSVADESTAKLMADFYAILLARPGSNSALALGEAKRNMIKSGRYSSPYFWAPFVLIGQ